MLFISDDVSDESFAYDVFFFQSRDVLKSLIDVEEDVIDHFPGIIEYAFMVGEGALGIADRICINFLQVHIKAPAITSVFAVNVSIVPVGRPVKRS